MKFLVFL
nr:truncated ORF8 protein [Severe acute respiratory syndrome coronavirus 2]QPG83551.1 truncated ORF8 protein [Severe acute respiratory syndrome coronavirus 2]QPG84841.1 truncated ORF8 protein [Severe acute respiratory syndrome coronavirus 2]QPG84889.1 truncated ORF8 protein [Severe acute respiratory syndrome coronavirus 2]QQP31904.1 truncated ORF8 protein [Severe acute respiratory syndrome coronavirus 2]